MQESGNLILSMDGLFGLPRKKSAGESFRDAIHGHLFFGEQTLVDEYVALASASVKHRKPKVYILLKFLLGSMWICFTLLCFSYAVTSLLETL